MSTLSELYPSGGGGGGVSINGLAQYANAPVLYTDLDSRVWLQAGNISTDLATYPDALIVGGAWDVAAAFFLQDFSVASQDLLPWGVFFRPDGLKMYVVGVNDTKVYEYDLSTAWNVTTSVFLQDFSVRSQDTFPQGVFFRPDGLKMYMIGVTNRKVYEYDLSTAWDITTASFLQDFSVASQDRSPIGVFFRPDGLKMYMVGSSNDKVYEYNLSTAWNVTTSVFLQDFSVASQDTFPQGVFFRPDGLKMYMFGGNNIKVYEYDLSTAWDITTASFLQDFSVRSQDRSPIGVFFRPDGLKMYMLGRSNNKVYEYDLFQHIGLVFDTGLDADTYVRIK
jgi:DNA-binding beta-propeller fold protein YncE